MRAEYERQKTPVKAIIVTADGKKHDVRLLINHGESLVNFMNSGSAFIEVEDEKKNKTLLARSFIQSITPKDSGMDKVSDEIASEKWRHHSQDPYIMLDVQIDASDEDIKNAYHKLARAYHPDRMLSMDLPPAMLAHGEEILKKINIAYEAILAQRRKGKKTA